MPNQQPVEDPSVCRHANLLNLKGVGEPTYSRTFKDAGTNYSPQPELEKTEVKDVGTSYSPLPVEAESAREKSEVKDVETKEAAQPETE